jgi:hypothetical protein
MKRTMVMLATLASNSGLRDSKNSIYCLYYFTSLE